MHASVVSIQVAGSAAVRFPKNVRKHMLALFFVRFL